MFSTSQFATGCRRAAQSTLFSSARMKSTLRKGTTALQNKELSDVRYLSLEKLNRFSCQISNSVLSKVDSFGMQKI